MNTWCERQKENGLLVWSEIPVYWTIQWENAASYELAENQLVAMIERDKNRAAVIIWSIANETPVSEARNQFLSKLATKARTIDPTRLLSAAMEKHGVENKPNVSTVADPLSDVVDIISFNQYLAWYWGAPDDLDNTSWLIDCNKPFLLANLVRVLCLVIVEIKTLSGPKNIKPCIQKDAPNAHQN